MLNKAILMGRLTATPEIKRTPSDIAVCSFTIAVDRQYKTNGERQADFIGCVAWRNTADFIAKYFGKGDMIAVDGRIETRSYTDKDGIKRKAFEIVVDNASFCGGKKDNSPSAQSDFEPVDMGADLPF